MRLALISWTTPDLWLEELGWRINLQLLGSPTLVYWNSYGQSNDFVSPLKLGGILGNLQVWRSKSKGGDLLFWVNRCFLEGKERSFYLLIYSFFSPKHIWCAWSNPEFWERRLWFIFDLRLRAARQTSPTFTLLCKFHSLDTWLKGAETAAPVGSFGVAMIGRTLWPSWEFPGDLHPESAGEQPPVVKIFLREVIDDLK